jgi:hypothetical protein
MDANYDFLLFVMTRAFYLNVNEPVLIPSKVIGRQTLICFSPNETLQKGWK